ncbi:MAG: twin-arginine translocase TatA/TatE family subunit [Planctomycetota bacterium]
MFGLGFFELMVVGMIAVMLFGKRLPEVAKSLGKSYQQFRRGLEDVQREVNRTVRSTESTFREATAVTYEEEDYEKPSTPKFEPPEQS